MSSERADDEADPLGPARPLLIAALELGTRAGATGDHSGSHSLCACAVRLARKVRGLGEIADFCLERALDEAEAEIVPIVQMNTMLAGMRSLVDDEIADEAAPTIHWRPPRGLLRWQFRSGRPHTTPATDKVASTFMRVQRG